MEEPRFHPWLSKPESASGNKVVEGCGRLVLAISTGFMSEVVIWLVLFVKHQQKQSQAKLDRRPTPVPDLWKLPPAYLEVARNSELLRESEGRFVYDTVYSGHPHQRNIYFPMAQFHQLLFKQKFAELLFLLECLGATHLSVKHTHS